MGDDNPAMILRDSGDMKPDRSLAYFEQVSGMISGTIVKLEAERGRPDNLYNTRLFTDRNEEIWLSGFTCGKEHAGSLGLCELVAMIGWDKYVPREEIVRIVLNNNHFRMEFRGERNKRKFYLYNGSSV